MKNLKWCMIFLELHRPKRTGKYKPKDTLLDVGLLQADSKEDLMANCYNLRYEASLEVNNKKHYRFVGPFEAHPASSNDFPAEELAAMPSLHEADFFSVDSILDEDRVSARVDEGLEYLEEMEPLEGRPVTYRRKNHLNTLYYMMDKIAEMKKEEENNKKQSD